MEDKTHSEDNNPMKDFPFTKENYIWMAAGVLLLCIGYGVMSMDTEPHGFGFFGLTLGPILVFGGFMIEFFAILRPGKKS